MTALIVGGTSGVGLASARRLAESGVRKIVLTGRNHERGESARESLGILGVDAHFVAGDAGDPSDALGIVESAASLLGSIGLLVNSVSPDVTIDLIHRTPLHDIPTTLARVALPPMLMTRAVLPVMREQRRGVILTVASDAAKVPTPGESLIGAAMAAIVMFTKTVALEAKRYGVRANVLTPSLISGTRTTERLFDDPFTSRLFAKAAELAHLGVTEPDDVAALVVFLAGPDAGKLTGQAISVNGGISAV